MKPISIKNKAFLNFISPKQVEEILTNNQNINNLDTELKLKMNEVDVDYIINRLIPTLKETQRKNGKKHQKEELKCLNMMKLH